MFQQYKHQLSIFFFVLNVILAVGSIKMGEKSTPILPTSFIARYWNRQITNGLPKPSILLSKSSPLTTIDTTFFTKLAIENTLSFNIHSFCTSANLYCFHESYNDFQRIVDHKNQDIFRSRVDRTDPIPITKIMYDGPCDKSPMKLVEPGKFFHESLLKQGTIMTMPDIGDIMPERSFLPQVITSKLPFSTSRFIELSQIFHVKENSRIASLLKKTLEQCEKEPSDGEIKKCVSSIESMIDFVVSIIGHNITVKSSENVLGSKQDVMVGSVRTINGGKVTEAVYCHQSFFPYLVYYCHLTPKVRVHEVDILDVKTKEKINSGVIICHLDTKAWKDSHVAFKALKLTHGNTEVCHWIFENDMIWTIAD